MATWKTVADKALKVTTNLTKMEVAKNPAHSLGVFYSKTLRALAKMPASYPYRKYTEQVLAWRQPPVERHHHFVITGHQRKGGPCKSDGGRPGAGEEDQLRPDRGSHNPG